MTTDDNITILGFGGSHGPSVLSMLHGCEHLTTNTAEGCRALAGLALDLIATSPAGMNFELMQLPAEVRLGFAERVLSRPISEANAWLAERADIADRSRERFVDRLRQVAQAVIVQAQAQGPVIREGGPFSVPDDALRAQLARTVADELSSTRRVPRAIRSMDHADQVELFDRLLRPGTTGKMVLAWAQRRSEVTRSVFYRLCRVVWGTAQSLFAHHEGSAHAPSADLESPLSID